MLQYRFICDACYESNLFVDNALNVKLDKTYEINAITYYIYITYSQTKFPTLSMNFEIRLSHTLSVLNLNNQPEFF